MTEKAWKEQREQLVAGWRGGLGWVEPCPAGRRANLAFSGRAAGRSVATGGHMDSPLLEPSSGAFLVGLPEFGSGVRGL